MAVSLSAALALAAWAFASAVAQPSWSKNPERANEGEVQFSLTPRDVKDGRFRVDLVVTTHTIELAVLDLRKAVELRVEGRVLRPVEAPALRGHHARGRLEFELDRVPEAFDIVIDGAPGMGTFAFRWP
jgi:hypothetical protein